MPSSNVAARGWLPSLLPPAAVALLLLSSVGMPLELVQPRDLRLLAVLGGIALLGACVHVGRGYALNRRAAADAAAIVRQITAGELHHFLPLGEDGAVAELSAAVNDLVDAMRARRLRDETEQTFERAMVRYTPNGLVLTDARGKVRRHNPSFAHLLPINGDPVGKSPIETVPVTELQEVIDETTRTRALSERTATVGRREVLLRGIPLADGGGCLGVVLDITSVRLAERARRDFVANVSHELRTPITAVVGYAESLLQDREDLPPWSLPMVEAIDRNARRLGALIEDVLHLSRIEARDRDLALSSEPLRPVVREVVARFALSAQVKGVALRVEDGPEVEALVNLDAFEHALANLVDNAVKYTPTGGNVSVRLWEEGGRVNAAVVDDGVGVDPIHHERIFERFYRVDPGRSREVGGTGLGLALVKHLCLAMGAEITLDSRPGEGSTFTLRLPTG